MGHLSTIIKLGLVELFRANNTKLFPFQSDDSRNKIKRHYISKQFLSAFFSCAPPPLPSLRLCLSLSHYCNSYARCFSCEQAHGHREENHAAKMRRRTEAEDGRQRRIRGRQRKTDGAFRSGIKRKIIKTGIRHYILCTYPMQAECEWIPVMRRSA